MPAENNSNSQNTRENNCVVEKKIKNKKIKRWKFTIQIIEKSEKKNRGFSGRRELVMKDLRENSQHLKT